MNNPDNYGASSITPEIMAYQRGFNDGIGACVSGRLRSKVELDRDNFWLDYVSTLGRSSFHTWTAQEIAIAMSKLIENNKDKHHEIIRD